MNVSDNDFPIKKYYVYLATNATQTVLYTGMTNSLARRMYEHKFKLVPGFTQTYNVDRLVYFETFEEASAAIRREKQLKSGSRAKKVALINALNPEWRDLYADVCT